MYKQRRQVILCPPSCCLQGKAGESVTVQTPELCVRGTTAFPVKGGQGKYDIINTSNVLKGTHCFVIKSLDSGKLSCCQHRAWQLRAGTEGTHSQRRLAAFPAAPSAAAPGLHQQVHDVSAHSMNEDLVCAALGSLCEVCCCQMHASCCHSAGMLCGQASRHCSAFYNRSRVQSSDRPHKHSRHALG